MIVNQPQIECSLFMKIPFAINQTPNMSASNKFYIPPTTIKARFSKENLMISCCSGVAVENLSINTGHAAPGIAAPNAPAKM